MTKNFTLKLVRPFFFILHSLKKKFRDLKLRKKILLFAFSILFINGLVFIVLFNYSQKIFSKQLYTDAADILTLSTQNIENEMKNLENTVSELSTSSHIQEIIRSIESSVSTYEEHTNRQKLMNNIFTSLNKKKYILSVHFIDPDFIINSVGSDTSTYINEEAELIYNKAFEKNGKPLWINPSSSDKALILLCPIREVNGLSLRKMGTICIRIQISNLVKYTMNIKENKNENFYIYMGNNELYHYGNAENSIELSKIRESQPYTIYSNGNKKNFIVKMNSKYCDWSFFYSIPYDTIYIKFQWALKAAILFYSAIFFILIILSILLSDSISKPLKSLIIKMQNISEINFTTSNISLRYSGRKDELGLLSETYQTMLKEIENLIQENYIKQLTIKDTQYRSLQAKINPHFMYNTLDSIYWMALNEKQQDISVMVFSLGQLLRESVKSSDDYKYLISLRHELEILNHYINIQKIRFKEHLTFRENVDPSLLNYMVPRMMLQPIVENSVKYSVESIADDCIIELNISAIDNKLVIQIKDNGIGVDPLLIQKLQSGEYIPKGTGIGLTNIISRLDFIYGSDGNLKIRNASPQGCIVELTIPIRVVEEEDIYLPGRQVTNLNDKVLGEV